MQPDLPVPTVDADQARLAAERILASGEFRDTRNPIERVLDWIGDQLGRFVGALADGGPGSIVAWLVLGATVVVVVLLGRRLITSWPRRSARPEHPSGVVVHAETVHRGRSADEWVEEAERCLARGDHRRALRARYRAVVTRLVRRGLLDDVPGRTEGEFRDELRERRPALAGPFDELTGLFEAVWYGHEPADAGSVERVGLLERVLVEDGPR